MNWDALGASGEIAGAIAVVITVIYLARQVRDNSKQVKLNTSQSFAALVQDAYAPVYANEQTLHAWVNGTETPDELSQESLKLYLHLMDRQMNNILPLLNHYDEGAISTGEFEHYRGFFDELTTTPGGQLWRRERSVIFAPILQKMYDR